MRNEGRCMREEMHEKEGRDMGGRGDEKRREVHEGGDAKEMQGGTWEGRYIRNEGSA